MNWSARKPLRLGAIAGAITLGLAATVVAAQAPPPGEPLDIDVTMPRGLSADGSDVLVADIGAGNIIRVSPDGTSEVVASGLPTATFFNENAGSEEASGPTAAVAVEGGYVVTIGEGPEESQQSVYFIAEGSSSPTLIADLGAYEQENNTDGANNPAGEPDLLSNPFSIVAVDDGYIVSNSGANALLKIDDDGNVAPFAIFEARENPLFPDVGGPTFQQVPTGMTVGPDGAIYVGTLTGFPFPTGEARVYRVADANGDGDALDDGEVSVYAEGLTTVTDVAFEGTNLLVTEFSTNMLAQAPGRVVRVTADGIEVVAEGLVSPTSILVLGDQVLVSQEFAGLVTDIAGVAMPVDIGDDDDIGDGTDTDTDDDGATDDDDADDDDSDSDTEDDSETPTVPTPADTGFGATGSEGSDALLAIVLASGAAVLVGASRRASAR